jgi:toxin-antitoxin system PIN domain toxin
VRALFDVNALLALFDGAHPFHGSVRAWWHPNQTGGWATCPLTQNGFVRIMSQPRYLQSRSPIEAIAALRKGLDQPGHEFWPDDISITDDTLIDPAQILGPNQVTDVYLLALAVKYGGRLVTFDRGLPLRALRGAEARHLVIL